MEYECPNPFPDIRNCPKGLKVEAAFCILGYIHLFIRTAYHGTYMVFFYHPGYAGWNFATPADLKSFWGHKDWLVQMIESPEFGPNWVHQYFKDHALARAAYPHSSGINGTYGVP